MKTSTLVTIVLALLLLTGGGIAVYDMTRGLRNNNPGNIRKNITKWLGLADNQTDPDFFQFATPEYGIRAMAVTLNTYMTRYGLNTIRGMISRWAPPSENDTEAYIAAVAKDAGVGPDDVINDANLPDIVAGIIKHENGLNPYSDDTINNAVAMA